VRTWGQPKHPALILLHGWMDVSASFQFVVDALTVPRQVIAPDWRGFGGTQGPPGTDTYWFPDYLADLDALLDALCPDQPVDLLGHSMGGNVAMLYAGIRPQRVRRLINLEGFGLPATKPSQAPARYAAWLDDLKQSQGLRDYGSVDEVAERLRRNNPRLTPDRAAWLAPHWARQNPAT
jgi:pimeloyl-ACP methyl ester carboxylesterase